MFQKYLLLPKFLEEPFLSLAANGWSSSYKGRFGKAEQQPLKAEIAEEDESLQKFLASFAQLILRLGRLLKLPFL